MQVIDIFVSGGEREKERRGTLNGKQETKIRKQNQTYNISNSTMVCVAVLVNS